MKAFLYSMFKKLFKSAILAVVDEIIKTAEEKARATDNTIDDNWIKVFKENKALLLGLDS